MSVFKAKRLAVVAVAAVAFAGAKAADISGAGATFPYPIYSKWADAYKNETGIGLNYQSIGSGGGIKQIKAKTVTFGASDMPLEQKDLDDYLRRRRFSLDTLLRTWVNDPGVVLIYEGNAIAAQHPALQVTLINSHDESVTLFFDVDTHLPVKKSFEWRDPTDRQKNLEEEVYENYRQVSGVMAPYNITRYFNGDMASQRFLNSVTINQGLDPAMFNPNSGYNPLKPAKPNKR